MLFRSEGENEEAEAVSYHDNTPMQASTLSHIHIPVSRSPALRAVPTAQIIENHQAPLFSYALQTFLTSHGSPIVHYDFDKFNLFTRLVVTLPKIPQVSTNKSRDVIRVSPPIPKSGRKSAEPAHLDFALIRTNEANPDTDGTALQGEQSFQTKPLVKARGRKVTETHAYNARVANRTGQSPLCTPCHIWLG